ncbi:hypothetical protein R3P38DRAFT_428064 [Favolaschia claudopus]|uniref:Protein kinase domain-containing protein n=1 Tax=Favolaschia claudopus TaxID=2862362 RepID=A0AAW0CNM0_9AGAR
MLLILRVCSVDMKVQDDAHISQTWKPESRGTTWSQSRMNQSRKVHSWSSPAQRREQITIRDDGNDHSNTSWFSVDSHGTPTQGCLAALLTSWKCRQRLLMLHDAERNPRVHHQLDATSRRKARQLMQELSEAREKLLLPASLFIAGVNDHDEHPTFQGGFGDVFQASYQNRTVALKRIRVFTANPTANRLYRLRVYKEALVWQGLRHKFILPLLGIDHTTFAPALCMVSPWMKHGTVLKINPAQDGLSYPRLNVRGFKLWLKRSSAVP